MIYLAFIIATGLLILLGGGGLVHNDTWFRTLQRRVDATEPPFWLGFLLLVVAPCAVIGVLWGVTESLLGGAGALAASVVMLLFAFGRSDYPTLTERFVARASSDDEEGAALILEEMGVDTAAESQSTLTRLAAREFLYEGYQRWFPPVFYFLLLGPLWAVAYRLIHLGSNDRRVPVGSLRHLVDWLPARLLMLTFALLGNFEACWQGVRDRLLDADVETDELLLLGHDAAGGDNLLESPAEAVERVTHAVTKAFAAWLVLASLLAIL